ncbi:MAG: homocysteine S-methyltransferase family protein [Pseudomonadota bacterium]
MSEIVLLDGGMGQELIRRSSLPPHPLWSAEVMLREPHLVRDIHVDMIRAGARVITVNAYSVTRDRLDVKGGKPGDFERLQDTACRLAREARDEAGEDVAIAGCLPPLHNSYRPDQVDPVEVTEPIYREIAERQAESVDLFLAETLNSGEQARGAILGAQGLGRPIWVALTPDDRANGRLRGGETLAEAVAVIADLPVDTLFVNCGLPEAVQAMVPALQATGLPWGAYANGFSAIPDSFVAGDGVTADLLSARGDVTPEVYAALALGWAEAGAAVVGGCCEIGPAHIAAVARSLREAGFTPVRPAGLPEAALP